MTKLINISHANALNMCVMFSFGHYYCEWINIKIFTSQWGIHPHLYLGCSGISSFYALTFCDFQESLVNMTSLSHNVSNANLLLKTNPRSIMKFSSVVTLLGYFTCTNVVLPTLSNLPPSPIWNLSCYISKWVSI